MSLFRTEVIDKKRDENIFGDVVLIRPVSFTVYTSLFILFAVSLIGFMYFGHFASKETVNGILNPQSGLVKVYAPQRGVVISRRFDEGDEIKKGDVIYHVSTERYLNGSEKVQALVAEETDKSIEIIKSQAIEQKRLTDLNIKSIIKQIEFSKKDLQSLSKEISFHKDRMRRYKRDVKNLKDITNSQYVAKTEYDKSVQIYLDSQVRLVQLERSKTGIENQQSQLEAKLNNLPIELEQNLLIFQKSLSQLRQRLAEIRGNQSFTIVAPASGRVSSLTYNIGDTIKPDFPLLTILPKQADLLADLYVPTRAAGFLHKDQEVKIRFDAFPYQKFGLYGGTVEQISGNIIIPGEVSIPIDIKEPVYKVSVKLDKQTVTAFGREHYLQVGMMLQGDLIRDRSRIIDWVLEPLYSLRGRG